MKKMNLIGESTEIMGIDLGTTNSAVAVYNAGTVPTLLPIGKDGKNTVPSCVKWEGSKAGGLQEWIVGEDAYKERYMPDVIYSIKRIMGSDEKVRFVSRLNPDNYLDSTPAEVSSVILNHIKKRVAELYKPLYRCIITVPAYFNQRQIEDTLKAAEYAKLECVQILKEPTSASYIYSQLGYADKGSVLIYDLGGGTFDVTHMNFLRRDSIPKKLLTSLKRQYGIELSNMEGADINDQYFCKVLGTYGDVHLGGDDIDKELGNILIKESGYKLTDSEKEELYLRCEEFKKSGFFGQDIIINGKKFSVNSNQLEQATDIIFKRTLLIIEDIDISDVKTIVLVGGSTKSQRIRDNLSRTFPKVTISAVLDPDATVALGAGSVAKAVANDKAIMYSDVLPMPIGILVDESRVEFCIPRNTSMPYSVQKVYHTIHDKQSVITLHIFQGLSDNPNNCTYLGRLSIDGVPEAPAGKVNVMVNFILDGNGTLKIFSKVDGIDREEKLVIENIFDVSNTENAVESVLDDFESVFMEQAGDNKDILDMFAKRRELISNSKDTDEVEQEIVSAIMNLKK